MESVLKAVRTELVEVETGESDEDGNVTTTTQLVTTETVVGTTGYRTACKYIFTEDLRGSTICADCLLLMNIEDLQSIIH